MSVKKVATVDEYMDTIPESSKQLLEKVRATIRAAAPEDAFEAIRWGMPTFQYKGQLLGYAAFTKHCSLFPMSLAVMQSFASELSGFAATKGSIHFTRERPLPTALLKKMVKARVAENETKKNRRG